MALSDMQLRQLRAKLDARHIRTRKANGTDLHYVEGWHVISEANRIFGYDAWDRRTVATKCVSSSGNGQHHFAAYTAKVRITVRAGDIIIVREGSGTGEGGGLTPGQAHEIALKSAETDATKRALATFGNPFGLALYDREQLGIRKRRDFRARPALGPWVVRSGSGAERLSFTRRVNLPPRSGRPCLKLETSRCCSHYGSRMSKRCAPSIEPLASNTSRNPASPHNWLLI
jgi:DNA recombination protein Rad52